MKTATYKMTEKLFLWPGEQGAWHFLPITKMIGKEIKEHFGKYAKGFRSLPVAVTIGDTTWRTSIFPDKTTGSFILPVKASVRKAEGIYDGEAVTFVIELAN